MSQPLRPGLRNELITKELARVLDSLDEQSFDRRELDSTESIERLGKHLLRVARRMRAPQTRDDIDAQTAAVNAAIDVLGVEFGGDRVSTPASLLMGVKPHEGLSKGFLPAHPLIPLTSSELLVGGLNEPSYGSVLQEELRCADGVDLICAFVGWTGFEPLKHEFRKLIERGGRIRVITSTYLGSTSAKALDEFVKLGAEVRVNYNGQATKLHAKAWLFRRPGELDTAFVGSSNLSEAALFTGLEWNVRLARADAPGVFNRIGSVFDGYWHAEAFERYTLEDHDRLDAALAEAKGHAAGVFSKRAEKALSQLKGQLADAYTHIHLRAKPHQQRVLDQLHLRRENFGEHRHLVVAATGTGKTVMAALDYARLCEVGHARPTLLFVAHREQILERARATFRLALQDPGFGEVLTGGADPIGHAAHVFAMVQTLHNRLPQIDPRAYDMVYVDEAHHGAATTWREVIRHFDPRELVGLTATPERSDGVTITDLFGGDYTTELRLWEAVDDQLLAPFEYVGVDDGTDLRHLAWHSGDYAVGELAALYTGDHERVNRILEALQRWIDSPSEMRALGFCVTVDHARFMAEQFTRHGFAADYLQGDHDHAHRDAVLARLKAGQLQVVFSVEVLGEGVDVPDVDTLLLLRPTQSPVLFAQQLGRGLRLAPGKDRCLVLDFIGQHRAEYRYEERFKTLVNMSHGSVRQQAERNFPFLPAGSAINLERVARERVARERVLAALKAAAVKPGLTAMRKDLMSLRSATLEQFLADSGRSLADFYSADRRKVSWTRLQRLAELPSAPAELDDESSRLVEEKLLRRIGFLQHVTDPMRVDAWFDLLTSDEPPGMDSLNIAQERMSMQLMHVLGMTPATLEAGFVELWRQPAVRSEIVELLTITGAKLDASPMPLLGLPDVPLMAHARYSRAEVFAALGISTVDRPKEHREGVYFCGDQKIQLMFVTLHKDDTRFSSTTQYKDHAVTNALFHWESPNNWRQDGPAMQRCIGESAEGSVHRLLFVREKSAGRIEGQFRCFGQVDLTGDLEGERPVALTWRLRQPLPELLFENAALVVAS